MSISAQEEPRPTYPAHPRGIPQYGLTHGNVLSEIDAAEARNPGPHITGNAYRGISMNDCVAEAYRLADRIVTG